MSGQPLVSALSVYGPAVGRSPSFDDIDELFDDAVGKPSKPSSSSANGDYFQRKPITERALASKENYDRRAPTTTAAAISTKSNSQQQNSRTPKKTTPAPTKPPFVVGRAPIRNPAAPMVSTKVQSAPATTENRAEIVDLKRQISELSHLLRQHVETKSTKRDTGTDPIDFEKPSTTMTIDAATNTEKSGGELCSKCKKSIRPSSKPPSPPPPPVVGIVEVDEEDSERSLCSEFDALTMQYMNDDQLADIAIGGNRNRGGDAVVSRKKPAAASSSSSLPKNHRGHNGAIKPAYPRRQHHQPMPLVETSPPKRRMAAVATTTDTFAPSFGTNGGVTLTRRRVMTMEQEVSIFDSGSKRTTRSSNSTAVESLPFGFSVASQEFMHRHGVLKQSSRPMMARQSQRTHEPGDYPRRNPFDQQGAARYPENHYDESTFCPPSQRQSYDHHPRPQPNRGHPRQHPQERNQQRQYDEDMEAYFDDNGWD